ncbi:MAG TPA: beta-propeller domain-containing protein [Polyangiales bacterium]|nr:beta-propeller domain-containing protein [Polyangiales bacterium]
MGGRKCSLWIGAAFTLLLACGDETGHMDTSDSQDPAEKADGTKGVSSKGAAGSGSNGSNSGAKPGDTKATQPKKDEPLGEQTEFFSADTQNAAGVSRNGGFGVTPATSVATAGSASVPTQPGAPPPAMTPNSAESAAKDASGAAQSSVQRGDIYRVLSDHRILNLNNYRGVQVLDVSDPSKPRVEGRLSVAGNPVEMYVVGDRAFVLLNGWQGYYGSRDDLKIRPATGGLVMSVDIQDRANPKLIDQAEVKGDILTSRLTQGSDGQAALYVAATVYDQQAHSVVKSFEVSTGELMPKSELDLGGYVQDVQATTDLMMVAAVDYSKMEQRSTVTVIDISHTDGTMEKGGTVTAQGIVQNKFNMDAYKGVLRVVSGANWGTSNQNRVETFSLKDLKNITPLDSCQLTPRDKSGNPEQLYATVFIENRAFFVTYFRQDPFHAFSIADDGTCEEHTKFLVSGWNDFLRPAINNTRLLGIGHNDINNSRLLSVSLYDAVNLDNSTPLLSRADIELNGAYSEANWDDRAFGVIENAVLVQAADGTQETGLLLLPFSGWDNTNQTQIAKVQLFTFSNKTITKRGSLDHGSPVRRSFEVEADTTANLSDDVLSLFDTGNPDSPKELGRADVAPSYSRVFVYGDHVARLRDNTTYYYVPGMKPLQSKVQIVSAAGDVDANKPVAEFEVPSGGSLTQVGDLLVSVYSETAYDQNGQNPKTTSQIQVWDLKDPTKPAKRSELTTDRLEVGGFWGYPGGPGIPIDAVRGGVAKCFDCGYPSGAPATGYVVGQAIVFASLEPQQTSLGQVTQCDIYAVGRTCTSDSKGLTTCENPYVTGGKTCVTPDGGEEQCTGGFVECDDTTGECKPTDEPAFTNRNCNRFEQFRYWQSYSFDALDLRNPESPTFAKRVEMPTDEEGTSVFVAGDTLYFNFQKPYEKKDDDRAYVKRFVSMLGFGDPQKPSVGDAINIPGEVITADGTTLYTRDFVWENTDVRTMVARLTVDSGKAHLQASETFKDRQVNAVKLDGAGHVLVSSDPVYPSRGPGIIYPAMSAPGFPGAKIAGPGSPADQPKNKLSILDDQELEVLGEADIDSWAEFRDAKHGRALYRVPGGLLVVDVADATKPKAQAYFPVAGWPNDIVFDGDSILFAAGMYGIYRLDAGVFNLLMQ